jgi:hypothetical protein
VSVAIQAASSGVNWSAIITGVVGVAGILGALIAVKVTASAEDRRAKRAEKRDIYARFLTAETSLTWVIVRYRVGKGNLSLLGDTDREVHDVLNGAIGEMTQAESILRLIAPDNMPADVGPLAGRLLQYHLSHFADTLDGDNRKPVSREYSDTRLALLDAMREDLGIRSADLPSWPGLLGQDPAL